MQDLGRLVLAAVLAVAACKSGKPAPPCGDVATTLAKVMAADMLTSKHFVIDGAALATGLARSCADDSWSAETRACFAGATDKVAANACAMTAEQQAHMVDNIKVAAASGRPDSAARTDFGSAGN